MACHVLRGSAGVHRADAVVLAGYGGEEAGTGLADVIFGHYCPAGRLPYTVPTGLEQLPPCELPQIDAREVSVEEFRARHQERRATLILNGTPQWAAATSSWTAENVSA
eukprot:COSAG04_NODE_11420_length_710_cov_0.684124_1_plen_108_part_10